MNSVRIPPVLDLIGLLGTYGRAVKHITVSGVVLQPTAAPVHVLNKPVTGDFEWYQIGLLWATLDKPNLFSYCKNNAATGYISNLEEYMCLYGVMVAALPRGTTGYVQLRGNLQTDKRTYGTVVMNRWYKDVGDYKVCVCDVAPLNMEYLPDGLKAVYNSLVAGETMNSLFKKQIFNVANIMCALPGKVSVGAPPILTAASWASVDNKTGAIVERISEAAIPVLPTIQAPVPESFGIQPDGVLNGDGGSAKPPEPIDESAALRKAAAAFGVELPNCAVYTPSSMQSAPQQPVQEQVYVPDSKGEFVRSGRTFYNRHDFRYNAEFTQEIERKLATSKEAISNLQSVLNACPCVSFDNLRERIGEALLTNFSNKFEANKGYTGFVLFRLVLREIRSNISCFVLNESAVESYNARTEDSGDRPLNTDYMEYANAKSLGNDLDSVLESKDEISQLLTSWKDGVCITPLECMLRVHTHVVLALLLRTILKLKCDIIDLAKRCDLLSVIMYNPYLLIITEDLDIDMLDLDKLAMLAGKFGSEECAEWRIIAYYHQLLCNDKGTFIDGRTSIPLWEMQKRVAYGFLVSKAYNNSLSFNKPYAVDAVMGANIRAFLSSVTSLDYFKLPSEKVRITGSQAIYSWEIDSEKALRVYVNSGFGILLKSAGGQEWLQDYSILGMEYAIYKRCEELYSAKLPTLEAETKERLLSDFEKMKQDNGCSGFALESKQKEACLMAGTPIMALPGGAGTGKTTSVEAILYMYERGLNIDSNRVKLLAPTGKASVRLREVTKRRTCTIASELLGSPDEIDADVIVVDESSMINVFNMYALLSKIAKGTYVIFVGDTAQLPPIGLGKPFALMLKYLPCVTLEVSKRAVSGSLVTKNANKLIDLDDMSGYEQGADFKIIPCSEMDVPAVMNSVLNQRLQAVGSLDTVQVVTPMRKEGVLWGASALNATLRSLFNPDTQKPNTKRVKYYSNNKECMFCVGDRVVNLKNHARALRFDYSAGSDFYVLSETETGTTGIMNGDIGILRDIIPSTLTEVAVMGDTYVRKGQNIWYALVEYEDVDPTSGNVIHFYIKYDLEILPDTVALASSTEIWCTEMSVAEIELAFALTVHKMQGSQSTTVIFPVFSLGYNSTFISNNLVYTAWTRTIEDLIVVGSTAAINEAKRIVLLSRRTSIYDLY